MSELEGCRTLIQVEQRLRQLRNELPHLSLISQFPLDDADVCTLRDAIRREIADPSFDFSQLENHGCLSVACFLVQKGMGDYHEGTYWPESRKILGSFVRAGEND